MNVKRDLSELTRTGIITIILVMLILFLTIGWRESLIAGLSIPMSFLISFVGLYLSGNSLNIVSLFSLILGIGILVDSGIVITEAIHTRYKKFGEPVKAARESIREYAWPLIAGTMTTVAVFVPLFFVSGIVGQFIKSIPFTLIFVLLASLIVALGFVPPIAVAFTTNKLNRLEKMQEDWNVRINAWYRQWLSRKLADAHFQRWFMRGLAVAFIVVMALPMSGLVKSIFFPGADSDFLYIDIETKNGTPLAHTDLSTRAVEEALYENRDIKSFATTIGGSSVFGGGATGSTQGGGKYANITINLYPKSQRTRTSQAILDEISKSLARFNGFTIHARSPQGGPPTGAPILVKFTGENLDDLSRAADIGERVLKAIPGTKDIVSSNRDNGSGFSLSIDRGKAAQVGLTSAQIASLLRTSVSGSIATTILKGDIDIDVLVVTNLNPNWKEPSDASVATVDSIQNLSVATPRGQVLLGSLLASSLRSTSAIISRENQKNIITVSSYLDPNTNAVSVSNAFNARIAMEKLPQGVSVIVGGETEDVNKSFRDMFVSLIGGMVLMLGILVLEFNSFRYAGYLLMLIPLSLIGVLGGLALTGSPISFPSLLGVIALAGIIINHAIILVDSMVVRMKNPEGRNLSEVVVDAAASRLRPIVLTTVTTVIGMVPLSMATGLWAPLAFSIMFGLTFAMILTLILTPILVYRHPGKQYWRG
jgi:HAE1 family hydrophobic/amphiphilic exporter-1